MAQIAYLAVRVDLEARAEMLLQLVYTPESGAETLLTVQVYI